MTQPPFATGSPVTDAAVPPPPADAAPARQVVRTGHPAVDAALEAMVNAADLPPDDQIAQYEAAHRILRETLDTIDEG